MEQVNHIIYLIAGCVAIKRDGIIAAFTVVPRHGNPMTGITISLTAGNRSQMRRDHQLLFEFISFDDQMTTVAGK